ncbi:MAG: membrane protein insertase YidC [Gammaproteobacteria bacterium]|nr:membrane protein insertase YidC [Gammaproteobacteria bacterium]
MNNSIKTALWTSLFTIAIILWFKWEAANAPAPLPQTQAQQVAGDTSSSGVPQASAANSDVSAAVPGLEPQVVNSGKLITVKTDVLELMIDTVGGTVVENKLLNYSTSITDKTPIKLFNSNPDELFHLESGVNSNNKTNATHQAVFAATKDSYTMTGDSVSVPLVWSENGVTVTKTFTFYKGRYDFDINQTVNNQSVMPWVGYQYSQLKRSEVTVERGLTTFNTFSGAAYSTPEKKYNKLSFDEMAEQNLEVKYVVGGWQAMIQHYFMGALIPVQTDKDTFYTSKTKDQKFVIGMYGKSVNLPVGASTTFKTTGFIGPKIKNDLARIAPNLDKATDYGFLFFISEFLFNVLDFVHSIVMNWGWAIVIVTLLIKSLLFPLAAKSFKSMAKMRKFQPEMERLRAQYGEDRQALGQKMMQLYKKEGINPASGCLPILIQIPIFLAFYYMLMESVELRQAPWIFWIEDLSIKDPYFVLPVINMVLMFIQQRLNPPPSDPIQRKVMMFLPLIFGMLFLVFPSGLVLYWAISNTYSIIQQYVITKRYGGLANPLASTESK